MTDLKSLSTDRLEALSIDIMTVWRVMSNVPLGDDKEKFDSAQEHVREFYPDFEDAQGLMEFEDIVSEEIEGRNEVIEESQEVTVEQIAMTLRSAAHRCVHVNCRPASEKQIWKLAHLIHACPNYGQPLDGNTNAILTTKKASALISDLL